VRQRDFLICGDVTCKEKTEDKQCRQREDGSDAIETQIGQQQWRLREETKN
ncbi:hypothetical protein S245_005924, partial [Arachis hypogaea]